MSIAILSLAIHEEGMSLLNTNRTDLRKKAKLVGQRLEDRWYESNCTDFSVYADPEYPFLVLDCYWNCARTAALNTITFCNRTNFTPVTITDVFAGSGQATVLLAKAFPNSTVFFHNTEPDQITLMRKLAAKFGATNIEVVDDLRPAELVFASEAMEHVRDPLAMLLPALQDPAVKLYVDSSSFNVHAIGHFPTYFDGDLEIPGKKFKSHFIKKLSQHGYIFAHRKSHFLFPRFYNGRPSFLVRYVEGQRVGNFTPFSVDDDDITTTERVIRSSML